MEVKFVELKSQYQKIKTEILQAIDEVLEATAFSGGPYVERFEKNFAEVHGQKHAIGVNSGTAALHVALWSFGVGPGDEVIIPTNTFFATAEAVSMVGAKPVFVDCDPIDYNINTQLVEGKITSKTKAIIAVHLYGQMAKMEPLRKIADKNKLILIEDSAQAHFAKYNGQGVGTLGDAACFSFYPSKNLGAYGEAGAVITNNDQAAQKMRAFRSHGSFKQYHHDFVGHNFRMEGFQGAILNVKLKYLNDWTEKRRSLAENYRQFLSGVAQVKTPIEVSGHKHVYHLYIVRVERREELQKFLAERKIHTGIHYPIPCHLQKAYENLGYKEGDFPVAEKYSKEILSLPMYPELTTEQIQFVSQSIADFYSV
jgi:dTDP-4-amino-4,6-dideoxygalactose transaminase